MKTTITDYISVSSRISDLGGSAPTGFSLLPENFETSPSIDEFQYVSQAATLKTLLRIAKLPQEDLAANGLRGAYIQNNAFELVLPTLFVSASLLSENQNLVAIALNVISTYATDFFKGMSGEKEVKFDIVVEKSKSRTCKRISYSGSAEGMKELPEIIRASFDE